MAEEINKLYSNLFSGFSKLDRQERLERLKDIGAIEASDIQFLQSGGMKSADLAEKFIENVIGYFQLPLGVATHFVIDGIARVIPMAVEETSIVAAASKTAKWIRENGRITTETLGRDIIGQIQVARVQDLESFKTAVRENEVAWIEAANREVASGLVRRGGGAKRLEVREIQRPDGATMVVLHVYADPCDAMGANIINQVCEFLKSPIEEKTGEKITMCILSNLVDSKLTKARVELDRVDPELAEKIQEASLFAQLDPYRAATNNKGVLNGIDPILIATGNDWRAVEAGVHAYAAESGRYRSITRWWRENDRLVGEIVAPIVTGVVGGVTTLHPAARMCLKILSISSSDELSRVCAAVGLVQNLGALRALTTVGIIEGHMKLHIRNLTLGAGATEREEPLVQKRLEQILVLHKRISLQNAIEVLKELRAQKKALSATESAT